jgi:hypothetical protein
VVSATFKEVPPENIVLDLENSLPGIRINSSSGSSLVPGTIWGPGTDFSLDISSSVYGLMELVHDLRVLVLGTKRHEDYLSEKENQPEDKMHCLFTQPIVQYFSSM